MLTTSLLSRFSHCTSSSLMVITVQSSPVGTQKHLSVQCSNLNILTPKVGTQAHTRTVIAVAIISYSVGIPNFMTLCRGWL